jgi:hypothetical protein
MLLAGKLFPGPHLYAGAGIVALWAVAASLVPAMQKGNDGARTLHITLNCINIGLFAWQVTHNTALYPSWSERSLISRLSNCRGLIKLP